MSFIQAGQGPHIGKINLLSGAGSKETDPLGLFKQPPPPPPPPGPDWQVNPNSAQQAAAAVAGSTPKTDATSISPRAAQGADQSGDLTDKTPGKQTFGA